VIRAFDINQRLIRQNWSEHNHYNANNEKVIKGRMYLYLISVQTMAVTYDFYNCHYW